LTDEQKQRFDAIGESTAKGVSSNGLSGLCSGQSGNFTQLPLQRIKQVLQLSQQQQAALDQLSTASSKAASNLEKSCPTEAPQNPAERLDAITKRLDAMIQAVNIVRPALNTFYLSLSDEQKARFNVMGEPDNAE
jgi:LTXXQ motif family protein